LQKALNENNTEETEEGYSKTAVSNVKL